MVEIKQLDDHALVQKFVEGKHECLEILITRHKSRIYTYIFMIVKNHAVAEDIFQDTFIKVIQSLKKGRYTENGKFVSWAIRIAHNLIIDHFRKEKHLSTVSNDETDVDIFNSPKFSDMNIEDNLVSEQVFREVRHLIDELPDDQRQVVIMRHYLGFSFREIAEHSGVSINTALGRMRYALINLRKLIEERQLNLTLS